jgi:hypothetical protein
MNKFGRLFRIFAVGLCLSLSACVIIRSSSISESTGNGSKVTAEYSDYGVLHLAAPDTLTSEADAALAKQCQSGLISGVQTELSMREFVIVQYYTIDVAGTCK